MKIWIARRRRSRRAGLALLYAVMASFTAAGMVTLLLGVSMSSSKSANTQAAAVRARYLAEGAIEMAKKEVQTAIANWRDVPQYGKAVIDGVEVGWRVRPTGYSDTTTDEVGIQTLVVGYEIEAVSPATVDDPDHDPVLPFRHRGAQARVSRLVHSLATPLFQFAVFYSSDLEVLPGPNMTLAGRVHSNRDMYLGSSGNTLTLNTNYVRAVGDIYRHRKDDPSQSPGTVNIRKWVANPFDASEPTQYAAMLGKSQLASQGVDSTSGYDSHFTEGHDSNGDGDFDDAGDYLPFGPGALALWQQPSGYTHASGNTVQCAEHDVGEAVVAQLGSVAMYEPREGGDYALDPSTNQIVPCAPGTGTHAKGFYHANAGLSIVVAADSTWKAYDESGIDVTSAVGSAVSMKSLYDARQANGGAGNTRVLDIDVQALHATGHWPSNGLVYAAHVGAGTGTNAKGIRLKNGSWLPSKLTVATQNPIYVQGDYNKGTAEHPKVGAAVIADAVNLLSNAWTGSKTNSNGLPTASNTAYNVALVTGNLESSSGHYNGGLENLPRFHENWTGKTCTIKGSFVNLWPSTHATGAWVYGGNRYQAPNRDFSYDTAFNSVLNLPPFTPMAVSARDVVTW